MEEKNYELVEDYGTLADHGRSMTKHFAKVKWFNNEEKFDIRPWSSDMEKYGKGITLNEDEAYELYLLLKKEFEI